MVTEQQKAEAQTYVGRHGLLPIKYGDRSAQSGDGEIKVLVKVIKARFTFGQVRVFVTPVNGEGHWWVLASRVTFAPQQQTA